MMNGRLNKLLLIFILLFSFCVSIGYSALNASISVTGDLVYRVPADIRITGVKISSVTNGGLEQYSPKYTKDTASFGLKLPNLNSTVTYEVTVTNKSSKRKVISSITDTVVGNTNISYTHNYQFGTAIAANSTAKVLLTYKYNTGMSSVPSNQIKENTIQLTFKNYGLYDRIQLLSNDSSNYIQKYTGDTSTFNGNEDVYYYYGAATNNNVLFANYCWKIVRTTDTGGVKLLYNGVPSSGKCNNTGDASQLTATQMNTSSNKVAFNSNSNSPADVGYMYNTRYETQYISASEVGTVLYGKGFSYTNGTYTLLEPKSATILSDYENLSNYHATCFNTTGKCTTISYIHSYDNRAGRENVYYINLTGGKTLDTVLKEMLYNDSVNQNSSTIKTAIDYWYSKNMTAYTKYLEDTVWCNDRSISDYGGWKPIGGSVTTWLYFKSYDNINNLICTNMNDRFTRDKANGNGALTYPVGLITRQEQTLAYISNNSPLASGNSYWTLSPRYIVQEFEGVHFVYNSGHWDAGYVFLQHGVRPAVSLHSSIEYSAGDGSTTNPYVIVTNS